MFSWSPVALQLLINMQEGVRIGGSTIQFQDLSESALAFERHAYCAAVADRRNPFELTKSVEHRRAELARNMVTAFAPVQARTSKPRFPDLRFRNRNAEFFEPTATGFGK